MPGAANICGQPSLCIIASGANLLAGAGVGLPMLGSTWVGKDAAIPDSVLHVGRKRVSLNYNKSIHQQGGRFSFRKMLFVQIPTFMSLILKKRKRKKKKEIKEVENIQLHLTHVQRKLLSLSVTPSSDGFPYTRVLNSYLFFHE